MNAFPRTLGRNIVVALFLLPVACDAPTNPDGGPSLQRLLLAPITDSIGTTFVPDGSDEGEGYVHGTLMGPGSVGGNDSLTFKPRIAGAAVRVHRIIEERSGLPPVVGPAIATTYTDADGRFTSPVIEGHPDGYVVVFTPPASSPYATVWTYASFGPQSHVYPWWVTAPLR